jgi:multidrug resistance efflux pump
VDVEPGLSALAPLVPGRVVKVEVTENQEVKAGAVLVRLDDFQARRQLQEAEADAANAREQAAQAEKLPARHKARLAQQQAALQAVQHRLTGARAALQLKQRLEEKQLASSQETVAAAALVRELEALEQAEEARLSELKLHDATAGIKTARASLRVKEARLEQARRAVEECALKAPVDGTIMRLLVGPGDVLGAQAKQPAVLFCPAGKRIIRAEVEQEFAGRVAVGQLASVQDDARAGATWRGRVSRLSDWYTQRRSVVLEPTQMNDTRTLECIIILDAGQPPLRIGQRVRVTLGRGQR